MKEKFARERRTTVCGLLYDFYTLYKTCIDFPPLESRSVPSGGRGKGGEKQYVREIYCIGAFKGRMSFWKACADKLKVERRQKIHVALSKIGPQIQ